jgi:isoleucyl-tRNA synthetase
MYRKLRNTARFLLANLTDFAPADRLPYNQLQEVRCETTEEFGSDPSDQVDRYVLHRLGEFCAGAVESYDAYAFNRGSTASVYPALLSYPCSCVGGSTADDHHAVVVLL